MATHRETFSDIEEIILDSKKHFYVARSFFNDGEEGDYLNARISLQHAYSLLVDNGISLPSQIECAFTVAMSGPKIRPFLEWLGMMGYPYRNAWDNSPRRDGVLIDAENRFSKV